jgi:hypothetical protein
MATRNRNKVSVAAILLLLVQLCSSSQIYNDSSVSDDGEGGSAIAAASPLELEASESAPQTAALATTDLESSATGELISKFIGAT